MEDLREKYPESLKAEEPMGAVSYAIPYTDRREDILPNGVPHSFGEALADIEEGEREFERGETYSHKVVMQMIWNKIANYAG